MECQLHPYYLTALCQLSYAIDINLNTTYYLIALSEIAFNARKEEVPYYRMVEEEALIWILMEGQQRAEFTQPFKPEIACFPDFSHRRKNA
ncbi:hypothetical protein NX023_05520 [Cytobacillus firmus]|nr:hypothetical protein [Cytobacillus firmus]